MIFFKKFIFSLSFLLLENIYLIFIYSIGDFLSIDRFIIFYGSFHSFRLLCQVSGKKQWSGLSELIP